MNKKNEKYVNNVFSHLQMIGFYNLHERLGYNRKRLLRFWDYFNATFANYGNGKTNKENLLVYCNKKGFNIEDYINQISTTSRFRLLETKGKKHTMNKQIVNDINEALIVYFGIADAILKEEFKETKKNIHLFNNQMLYYIDSYTRKQPNTNEYYLDDVGCNELLMEECKLDVIRGKEL